MRNLLILLILTVLVLLAVFNSSPKTDEAAQLRLLPTLAARVNDVATVTVKGAGDASVATLTRGDSGWTLVERDGFPVDVGLVRQLLLALGDATLIEPKTARPANYAALGVEDVTAADAKGLAVSLAGLGETVGVIVGNAGQGGTFVRRVGEEQSWLADFSVPVARETTGWLLRQILDIPSADVQRITLSSTAGDFIEISKDSREQTDFSVTNVPAGRELVNATVANSIGNALANLQLDDVQPLDAVELDEKTVFNAEFLTFEGLGVLVTAFVDGDARKVQLKTRFDEAQAAQFLPPEPVAEEGKEVDAGKKAAFEAAKQRVETARERAATLAAQTAKWIYSIPAFRYDNFAKQWTDLLQPLPEAAASDAPSNTDSSAPLVEILPDATGDASTGD